MRGSQGVSPASVLCVIFFFVFHAKSVSGKAVPVLYYNESLPGIENTLSKRAWHTVL